MLWYRRRDARRRLEGPASRRPWSRSWAAPEGRCASLRDRPPTHLPATHDRGRAATGSKPGAWKQRTRVSAKPVTVAHSAPSGRRPAGIGGVESSSGLLDTSSVPGRRRRVIFPSLTVHHKAAHARVSPGGSTPRAPPRGGIRPPV